MTAMRKTHREVLQDGLARALLNVPVVGESISVGERLEAARKELQAAVELANQELSGNPLAEILAEHAMRQIGKRGAPQIVVDPDGSVMLEVNYETSTKEEPPQEDIKRKSALPPITVLRSEAEVLGIDHGPFGKNKTRLLAAIQDARGKSYSQKKSDAIADLDEKGPDPAPAPAAPMPAPARKMTKTAPALTPARVVQPDHLSVIPDEEDDLAGLFGSDDTKSDEATPDPKPTPKPGLPRKPLPSAGPARKFGGRSLSELASKATEEVNIDALLAKPAPKPPSED